MSLCATRTLYATDLVLMRKTIKTKKEKLRQHTKLFTCLNHLHSFNMGNCLNCCDKTIGEPPVPASSPTKEEVIESLQAISDTIDLTKFVYVMKQMMDGKKPDSTSEGVTEDKGSTSESAGENTGMWSSVITTGATFLTFVNDCAKKIEDKKDLYSGNSKVVAEVLGQIGQLHWAVGGLSIAAYLIQKIEKVSENKAESLELLRKMVDLATTVITLMKVAPEEDEKLKKAVTVIVQGSTMCVSQIYSEKIFSFMRTSVDSQNLIDMSNKLKDLYRDLNLTITAKNLEIAKEIKTRQRTYLPLPKPKAPKDAVGIEKAQQVLIELLNMAPKDKSTLVVVVYGSRGMGKTTLATSVVAMLNLEAYNNVSVTFEEEKSRNKLIEMQEKILHDAFPSYNSGKRIKLRNLEEGRARLIEAFQCRENKPVFLNIDNALGSDDLEMLLPDDLSDLPKGSRIFVTTRKLEATDALFTTGIERIGFPMIPLKENDA